MKVVLFAACVVLLAIGVIALEVLLAVARAVDFALGGVR